MTYSQYLTIVNGRVPTGWRRGQFMFNTLHDLRPDLSEATRGGKLDPFYDDSRIPEFLSYIAWMWDNTEGET